MAHARELRKQAGLLGAGVRAGGRFLGDSVASPIKKGLPRLGTAIGLAGAARKGQAIYHGFDENAHRAMLGMTPPKTTLASVQVMNLEELIKVSAVANPEAMNEVADCFRRLSPELVPELVAEFQYIADHVNEKSKEAGAMDSLATAWGKFKGHLGAFDSATGKIPSSAAKTLAGSLVVGLGLAASTDFLRSAKSKLTGDKKFKQMMEAHPYLRERPVSELRQAFKSLQHFAPDVASDPLASGAIVYRLANSSPGDHDRALRDAVAIEKDRPRRDLFPSPKIDFDLSGGKRYEKK